MKGANEIEAAMARWKERLAWRQLPKPSPEAYNSTYEVALEIAQNRDAEIERLRAELQEAHDMLAQSAGLLGHAYFRRDELLAELAAARRALVMVWEVFTAQRLLDQDEYESASHAVAKARAAAEQEREKGEGE